MLINLAGRQMLNMVENILDVTKFKNKQIKINLESYSIRKITEHAINDLRRAFANGIIPNPLNDAKYYNLETYKVFKYLLKSFR